MEAFGIVFDSNLLLQTALAMLAGYLMLVCYCLGAPLPHPSGEVRW
jgi:hypothetical protein